MENQVVSEIQVRVKQFKFARSEMRAIYKKQIAARLDEYDEWCETHREKK